ncbi:oligosaccharide flippase family protein [Bifidobacterium sp. ESL0775]|uniref:oligosaccharide flippase family protein n=1 Tax=Bifidobacterium sp. ESL0775 TaxID=2983230 RepID=UPI0023FA1BB4|nr:oligosaccharide flippase family protein [Bifidobacterium sp. ESL0775]WEV69111.1 oligosaccharide flippase family protein [Bifidobacterium sp. ESL0775]
MSVERSRGALLGYANIVINSGINLLYTPVLIRMLGQSDYGVFQMTNSVIQALTILSMGFDSAYVKFYSDYVAHQRKDRVRQLNGMYLIIFLCIALLATLCGLVLLRNVDFLFSRGLTNHERTLSKKLIVIMIYSVAISFPGTVFDSYITVHERFIFQQSRQILTNIAVPFLALLALYTGMGAIGVALAKAFMSTILLGMNIRYAVGKLDMRFSFSKFGFSIFKSLAVFSFWIFLHQLFDAVNNYAPNFLLGALGNSTQVAIFAVAQQIRNLFAPLSLALSSVFVPKINKMVAEGSDNEELTRLMARVGRYQLIVFCFLYCGFVVVGRFFIRLWAGSEFDDAYLMILIMVLPLIFDLTQTTGLAIQRAKNKQKARSLIYIAAALVDIAISVIFIPKYGCWATVVGYVVSLLLSTGLFMNWYYNSRLGLNMRFFWRKMVPVLLVSAGVLSVSMFVTAVIPVNSVLTFLFDGFVYVSLFVTAAWFCIATKSERSKIKGRLLRKNK